MALHIHIHRKQVAPIYARMPVMESSAKEMQQWAPQGFPLHHDLHVTTAWSRKALDWATVPPNKGLIVQPGKRNLARWGDHTVLLLDCPALHKCWAAFMAAHASWDFPNYNPHITLSKDPSFPLNVAAFDGRIVLGAEQRGYPEE